VNIGIAFWAEGNYAKANELFTRVELADIQENLTEAAIVSRIAMNDTANREALLRYLIASPNDTVRIAMLDSMVRDPLRHWLLTYLKGKGLHRLQRYGEALGVLQQLDPGVPEKTMEAIRLKTLGSTLFRMKRFQEAKVCFWVSLNSLSTEVARDEINDWIDRCEWILEHGLK
jgi:tetratricopeptide (TPR) repeat protein